MPAMFGVSPATIPANGTFTVTLQPQAQNAVFAGPVTGPSAAPTFRALTPTDIPVLTSGHVSDFSEATDDRVAALLVAGPNVTLVYDDVLNTLTVSAAGGGTGTVTSVGMTVPGILSVTPGAITTSGTFTVTLQPQAQNAVFAGPTTGPSATPTFRALVPTDIPVLTSGHVSDFSEATDDRVAALLVAGPNVTLVYDDVLNTLTVSAAGGGTGTVTSVGMTVPGILSVAPGAITTSGTFVVSLVAQAQNVVFAGPTAGPSATPTFRALVPTDIPVLTSGHVSDFSEATDDRVAALLVAGPNVTLVYDDVLNTLTVSAAGGGTGTVTSVGMTVPSILSVAPGAITTSGTFAVSLQPQAQNVVFAGPTTGPSAAPTFRALVPTDIPVLTSGHVSDFSEATDDRVAALLVAGPNVTLVYDDVLNTLTVSATGGGTGTVTSVGMTVPGILSVTPGTITTSGTFAVSLQPQAQNVVFAGPTAGPSATPTFRALVPTDIPPLTSAHVTDFSEATDDRVAALFVAGTNISLVYDDVLNTLTVSAAGAVAYTWPAADGLVGDVLTTSGTGALSWITPGLITDAGTGNLPNNLILNHDSTATPAVNYGARLLYRLKSSTTSNVDSAAVDVLWTTAIHAIRTSAFVLSLVSSGSGLTERLRVGGDGLVSTVQDATAVSSVTNVRTYTLNCVGFPSNGFGARTLYRLESSTANSQDAAALDIVWTTVTHASRSAAIVLHTVHNGGALAERFRIASDGTLTMTQETTSLASVTTTQLWNLTAAASTGANFGHRSVWQLRSSTTAGQDAMYMDVQWSTATHASRTSYLTMTLVSLGVMTPSLQLTPASLSLGTTVATSRLVVDGGSGVPIRMDGAGATQAAGGGTGTLTTLPASATPGNPQAWVRVNVNGINYVIPAWAI